MASRDGSRRFHRRVFGPLLVASLLIGGETLAAPSLLAQGDQTASEGRVAIGFSNLVLRLDREDEVGLAAQDFRIFALEALRARGFHAVGAENLVFGKDHTERAELLLGGTVRELDCLPRGSRLSCRIGIEWQVLDVAEDRVVYKMTARSASLDFAAASAKTMGKILVLGALRSLTERQGFRRLFTARTGPEHVAPVAASIRACDAPARSMPEMANDVLSATVLVESGGGFGTGFFLSADGYALTAAHVVPSGKAKVRMHTGEERPATVVRVSRRHDVALLRVEGPGPTPCLTLAQGPADAGADVYAIGSPASAELAFSLTRGIVSGVRNLEGVDYLQTDASVSPGNSGGPLIGGQGQAMAVVTWKVAGKTVEGVAFGVPVRVAMQALGLTSGATTAATLGAVSPVPGPAAAFTDAPDPTPSLDPEGEARARRRRREEELTPGYVPTMRWAGLVLASAGAFLVLESSLAFDDSSTTYKEFKSIRLRNDIGWGAMAVGAGAITASVLLMPTLPEDGKGARANVSLSGAF